MVRLATVTVGALVLVVELPVAETVRAQVPSDPPIELTSTVDAEGNVVVEHGCPAGAAFGTYPLHVDILSFFALAPPGESTWVDDRPLGTVAWFVCATNFQSDSDDPTYGSYDDTINFGCFNSEGDPATGKVERVVPVDCGGTMNAFFGESFGEVGFDYPRPRLTPYDTVVIGDRCVEPLRPTIRSAVTGDVVAAGATEITVDRFDPDPTTGSASVTLVGRCEPDVDLGFTGPPFCATIDLVSVDGVTQIEKINGTNCVDLGVEFEVSLLDDDVLHVHSPCADDQRLGNEQAVSDVIGFDPWGEVGQTQVDRTDPPGRFNLTCFDDDFTRRGPSACFAMSDFWAEDQREPGRYACGSGYGLSEHDFFTGFPLPSLPYVVSVRSGALDLHGGCWSDTVPTISLADGAVVAQATSIRADEATTVSVPELSRDPHGVSSLVLVVRCVADGSTGLPSGRPICVQAWRSPNTLETFDRPFCSQVGVDDVASTRVTLSSASLGPGEHGYVVGADCVDGNVARVVEIDSAGRVVAEIGRTSANRWQPVTLRTAAGVAPEDIAGQCIDPASIRAGAVQALAAETSVNCFSSVPVVYAFEGDSVFSHRACGFVALRLPDTGRPTVPIVFTALLLIVVGTAVRRLSRQAV